MIPAMPVGCSRSQTSDGLGVERALDVVERRHLLAVGGAPHV